MRRNHILAAMLIALLLLVGGCAGPAEPAAEPTQPAATDQAEQLVGVVWNCYEFKVAGSPQTVPEDTPITAEFAADGTLSGNSGVNNYNTTYTTEGEKMTIGPEIASTKMAGPEEAMNLESNYLTTLPTATTYNITGEGELVLLGSAGSAIARYRPAE